MEYYMEIKSFSQIYSRHSLKVDFFNRPEIYPNTLSIAKSKSEYMIDGDIEKFNEMVKEGRFKEQLSFNIVNIEINKVVNEWIAKNKIETIPRFGLYELARYELIVNTIRENNKITSMLIDDFKISLITPDDSNKPDWKRPISFPREFINRNIRLVGLYLI